MRRRSIFSLLFILGFALGVFFFYRHSGEEQNRQPTAAGTAVKGPARSYQIDASLDIQGRLLTGVCRLNLNNDLPQELTELYFHLYPNAFNSSDKTPAPPGAYPTGFGPGGIEVWDIKVNNQPITGEVDDTVLRVPLKAPLRTGGGLEVEMPFKVTIPPAAYRFGQTGGITALGNWYPVLAVHDASGWRLDPYQSLGDPFYSQVSDYQVSLVLPTEQVVASTGLHEREEILKGGLKKVTLKAERVRDFALVASADFHLETLRDGDITLRGYSLKGRESSSRMALHAAAQALRFYGNAFASPYPFGQFSVVEVPMEGLSGMEYPMLTMINSREYSKNDLRQWQPLISHEVAHQWWYGIVGSDQFREPWIDEGLAEWSSELFLREQNGLEIGGANTAASTAGILRPLTEFASRAEYYTQVYHGGAMFWAALENRVGGERLLGVCRALLSTYQYREVTTAQLLDLIEKEAGTEAAAAGREFLGIESEKTPGASPVDENPVNNIINEDLPDLVIQAADLNRRGDKSYLVIEVLNRGRQAAGGFSVTLEEPAGPRWTQRLAGLQPGRSYTLNCPTSGKGVVVVDSLNEVDEGSEENNRFPYGGQY